MKQVYLLPMLLGFVLLVSFQNCSQSNFESAGDSASQATLADKTEQFDIGSRVRDIQELGAPIACPMVMCAAPPENCHYEQDSDQKVFGDRRDRRCGASCGRLVCNEKPEICPAIRCQAPPEGCRYVENSEKKDSRGCNISCGDIVCEDRPPKLPPIIEPPEVPSEPIICPMYMCAAPPDGCHLAANNKKDENGCNIGCGDVVCPLSDATEINPTNVLPIKREKPIICPMYMCAAPPSIQGQRCEYSGIPGVDKNGCAIGCGVVACADEK
jgi:hypothetical protein